MTYAMLDIGWAYMAAPDVRLGFFVGYHYWSEKATAYGLTCNQPSVLGCPANDSILIGSETAVLSYQPTWHVLRIGAESRISLSERWSVSGEFAGVPYASLRNADSHLLRQDSSDLGPAPNIITKSSYAFGIETELFVNYAVTPNIQIGAGVRYWGLAARDGGVTFGPSFSPSNSLNRFDEQRYGVLLEAKGRF
jgi:hypothetical protein